MFFHAILFILMAAEGKNIMSDVFRVLDKPISSWMVSDT